MKTWRFSTVLLIAAALSCMSVPRPPMKGSSQVWGHVRVMPREGVHVSPSQGNAYGDRRMRGVSFVDYSTPGFSVVFVEGGPKPTEGAEVAIRDSRIGVSLDPAAAVVGASGRLSVRNVSTRRHVLSYPAAGLVRAIAPNEIVEIEISRAGAQRLFLLDAPEVETIVFAAPGAFSRVSATGRFVLTNLPPGRRVIHAWNHRFPPASEELDLKADIVIELDFNLGVGRREGHRNAN